MHVSEVDYIIDGDDAPLAELPNPPPTEIDRAVARLIADEIEDGACLQIGIGGMPNAVCSLLLDSGAQGPRRAYRDADRRHRRALPRRHDRRAHAKALDPGKVVYTFALGSRSLYAAIDRNPDFHFCPVDHTNLPHVIMQNDRVVAINNTTQIDLQGQAASEIRRPPAHQRHRRPAAVRARRLRLEGRQVVHLPGLDLRRSAACARAGSCWT